MDTTSWVLGRVLEVDRDANTARPRPSNRDWSSSRDCRRPVRLSTKRPSAAAVAAATGRRLSLPSDRRRRLRNSRSHRNSNRCARSKAGATATSCARKAASPPVKKMSMASSSQPLPARYTIVGENRGKTKARFRSSEDGQVEKEISQPFFLSVVMAI